MYTDLEKAIQFSFVAHANQKRRNKNIEFVIHPVSVGMMVKDAGCSDEYVISAILHDVIEDTSFTYEDIKKEFGEKIANDVLLLSENQDIDDYIERKTDFLNKLKNCDENILIVECADKLHNLLFDYEIDPSIIDKHSSGMKWFYSEIYKIVSSKCSNKLVDRFKVMIEILNKNE